MRARTLIVAGLALLLAGGVWVSRSSAQGYGWGMMGGNGPGYHMGSGGAGGGPGSGQWQCPGFAGRDGYGPGMMLRYGRGDSRDDLKLTTDDVKTRMERWLKQRDNPRLKLGDVKEKDADSITVDVVTKDNSLVERFVVDRHTGFIGRDNT
jgi:hypothetical protein